MALPDGLTEEDLKNGIVRVTEPSGGGIDVGEEVFATISRVEVVDYEGSDGKYYYLNVVPEIQGDEWENLISYSLNEGRMSEGTRLGQFLQQLGFDLAEVRDEDFNLFESLEGTELYFTADEEEADDEDDDSTYLAVATEEVEIPTEDGTITVLQPQVRPADDDGASASTESSDSSDDDGGDDGDRETVAEIVEAFEDDDLSEAKKAVAKTDGSLMGVFNDMVEDGSIEVDDDDVVQSASA